MKWEIQEIAHDAKFKSASARVCDMNWDFVIPAVKTADAVQATEPAMNSEQFAAFYERSARPLWAYLARVSADPALAAEYAAVGPPRGEIVILVGAAEARPAVSEAALDREIAELLEKLSVRDAAAAVAAKHGLPRRQIYARALALAGAQR